MAEVHIVDIDGEQWDIKDLPLTTRVATLESGFDSLTKYLANEEVNTGKKWIDGKTIYRRVIRKKTADIGGGDWFEISTDDDMSWVPGVSSITPGSGFATGTQTGKPKCYNGLYFKIEDDKLKYYSPSGIGFDAGTAVLIEYTKTIE